VPEPRLAGGVTEVLRYAAFTREPDGGNPAGVVLDAGRLGVDEMQRIAADVGFSETAFLTPRPDGEHDVRYFSPLAEVPFCGHATLAAAVAHAERHGPGALHLRTASGAVDVVTALAEGGGTATLTSVPPVVRDVADADVDEALAALGWSRYDLDGSLPPRVAFAGAHHLVLAVRERDTLRGLAYAFDRLGALMAARGWTTLQLVFRTGPLSFDARNPFPPGGVVEDPATGAAAAALGAYLRALGQVQPPATVTVTQGEDMGRPSTLLVDVPPGDDAPVRVTGSAVAMAPVG
jgi:PhzF family phenazine biosynthesis protein